MKKTIVPLELIKLEEAGFHLLVEVSVFGHTFQAVLDTGASKTVFDKHKIQNHIQEDELLISDKVSTGLGTNNMESHTLNIPVLKIGRLKICNFEAAILDLSTISQAYAMLDLPPVIGVIGGDILNTCKAQIDYGKLTLNLYQ